MWTQIDHIEVTKVNNWIWNILRIGIKAPKPNNLNHPPHVVPHKQSEIYKFQPNIIPSFVIGKH